MRVWLWVHYLVIQTAQLAATTIGFCPIPGVLDDRGRPVCAWTDGEPLGSNTARSRSDDKDSTLGADEVGHALRETTNYLKPLRSLPRAPFVRLSEQGLSGPYTIYVAYAALEDEILAGTLLPITYRDHAASLNIVSTNLKFVDRSFFDKVTLLGLEQVTFQENLHKELTITSQSRFTELNIREEKNLVTIAFETEVKIRRIVIERCPELRHITLMDNSLKDSCSLTIDAQLICDCQLLPIFIHFKSQPEKFSFRTLPRCHITSEEALADRRWLDISLSEYLNSTRCVTPAYLTTTSLSSNLHLYIVVHIIAVLI